MLHILIQSVNSVKKPCYIEDQPNLALFLNRVKPGIALSETLLSGDPLYIINFTTQQQIRQSNKLSFSSMLNIFQSF